MKNANLAQNITALRRDRGITQEHLAEALSISPQAVSKWETGTSQPDTLIIPLIADYFGVSIDYLYYGEDMVYGEIYDKNFDRVRANPQMSEESYKEAHRLFAAAHHGIFGFEGLGGEKNYLTDIPTHISNENGVSLLDGRGYGAIVTRDFFERVDGEAMALGKKIFTALSGESCLTVVSAIISMSDISFGEMKEKLGLDDDSIRSALDILIEAGIVIETASKHKSLGTTYTVTDMYHTCLCIILATVAMEKLSLGGISCCMGYGDYPVKFE